MQFLKERLDQESKRFVENEDRISTCEGSTEIVGSLKKSNSELLEKVDQFENFKANQLTVNTLNQSK